MTTTEIWRDAVGFSNYEVSNMGRVRNKHTKMPKSQRVSKNGYCILTIKQGGKQYTTYAHRMVALAFLPREEGKECVNHKDENKQNNAAENLEWCTPAYNNHYGTHLAIMTNTKRNRYGKRIRKINPEDGCTVAEYRSTTEAAEEHHVTPQAIYWALLKPTHTAVGYRWEVCE